MKRIAPAPGIDEATHHYSPSDAGKDQFIHQEDAMQNLAQLARPMI
jgi:hypothetical protein